MIIRSASVQDLSAIAKFARGNYYFNVPDNEKELKEILEKSEVSFNGEIITDEREYVFVMEHQNQIVGTSCIIAKHGTPEAPHLYFKIEKVEKYSETIKSGFIQEILRFEMNHNGPTEIGGLVVHPKFRNHPTKIGKQLSYVRFNFIKSHRSFFKEQLLAEMMAPVDEHGKNLLWEYLGRHFVNLNYTEADRLSRINKEFVIALFPQYPVYLCLLPTEVRQIIATVQKETEPALHLLKKIGFQYLKMIDPFDGGPHLWAETDQVEIIKNTIQLEFQSTNSRKDQKGLISVEDGMGFRAKQVNYNLTDQRIELDQEMVDQMQLKKEQKLWLTPYL